jgi:hypothetical protein
VAELRLKTHLLPPPRRRRANGCDIVDGVNIKVTLLNFREYRWLSDRKSNINTQKESGYVEIVRMRFFTIVKIFTRVTMPIIKYLKMKLN